MKTEKEREKEEREERGERSGYPKEMRERDPKDQNGDEACRGAFSKYKIRVTKPFFVP